jgi:hypothetical protein
MLYDLAYMGSLFLHNLTDDITYCTSAVSYSIVYYASMRLAYQSSCNPFALVSLSVAQNVVANGISLYNIY